MARISMLSDDTLRQYLNSGFTQKRIADLAKVSEAAISRRVKNLDTKAVAKAPPRAVQAVASIWDTRKAAEENYHRALSLIDECDTAKDKTRVVGEIRQHLQFAMQVIETLYAAQEVEAFMDEVLKVLEEVDPDISKTVLNRLAEKRALRSAFLPH